MLQVSRLGLAVCAFICSLMIQGSAVHPSREGTPGDVSSSNSFISPASVPIHQPNGFQIEMPPSEPALAPQTIEVPPPSTWPSPSASLPNLFVRSPAHNENVFPSMPFVAPSWKPQHPGFPPFIAQALAPAATSSSGSQPYGQPHLTKAPAYNDPRYSIAPGPDAIAPRGNREAPPPYLTFPEGPPSLPPDVVTRPELPGNSRPVKPIFNEPPSSPPVDPNASPNLAPAPTAAMPVAIVPNRNAPDSAPASHSPAEGPLQSHSPGHFNDALPPQFFSKSTKHHPAKTHMTNPAPVYHAVSPAPGPSFAPLVPSPVPSSESQFSSAPAPPTAPSDQAKTPQNPRVSQVPPLRALPPPPPQQDCAPLTCAEPLTYGPAESSCLCVLPIQVGLRLTVALYTFFPLVSELAAELGASVFMKQSQVRIVGANADGDDPEKTIVLIDLLPLGERFDFTTTYLTYKRIWDKQVAINASYFGDFDVLYVRYPGLPSSPPFSPPITGIIPSKPYPGQGNNGRTEQPLGVDVNKNQHKHQLSKSTLSIIILSCFVAFLTLGTVLWVLIVRHGRNVFQSDPTPPTTARSFEKSSGMPISLDGGGTSSSFSFVSSMPAYTDSVKTFSLSDIEKATEFFNETRVLGEGGFGRVFSGVLQDGTKVAVKVLKRYDQQGGREFLSEVEMLSRLHHRNLVKLIGICIEERTCCLVYELIPNGSVESHLHGFDKERSPLDWSARLKIALGAARALAYLHEDSSPRVIHRDFKASNILLEDDFTPKVSDFGLARSALDEANKHISTRVMGTFGYVAPEYAMTGHLLVKSDVYSYGVVLLELLTGKKPVDMSQPPGQENLVSWARPLLTNREDLESIIDPSLGPNVQFDSIAKVAAIASTCVQPEVSHRPFMGEVVQALKLVCNECSLEDLLPDAASPSELAVTLLTPSSVTGYDYRDEFERELSMSSELLCSSAKYDSESFRRCASSGPLKTGKGKASWKTMRGVSVSEHGMLSRLWPGSH